MYVYPACYNNAGNNSGWIWAIIIVVIIIFFLFPGSFHNGNNCHNNCC